MLSSQIKSSTSRGIQLFTLILVLGTLMAHFHVTSARYLPTRADESRKELIKQLLKEIMDMPQQYEPMEQQRFLPKPYFNANPVESAYLSKRSAFRGARILKQANDANNALLNGQEVA